MKTRLKGNLRSKKSWAQMKEREKCNKTSHHRPQCAKWFLRYSISKSGIWARWTSPFCWFSASFSPKYDVTDAMLQGNGKWKCNISGVFCSICLKLCRLLELGKGISPWQPKSILLSIIEKQKIYCLSKYDVQKVIWNNTVWLLLQEVSSFEEKWVIHSSYCEKTIVFCFFNKG